MPNPMAKNPDQEAFPCTSLQNGGLTKREYMALTLQSALVSHWAIDIGLKRTDATFSDEAVRLADALLKSLESSNE